MSQDVRGMTKTLSGETKVEVLGADASWTLVADHREDGDGPSRGRVAE